MTAVTACVAFAGVVLGALILTAVFRGRGLAVRRAAGTAPRLPSRLDDVQRHFVAMVSHELRTPLTAIRGALQLLMDPGLVMSPEDREALARTSLHSTERLIRTVNDILDLSTIEAGQLRLRPQPCGVTALVDDALQVVGRLARQGGLAIRVDVPAELPLVHVDVDRTVQALVNLLANAVTHSPVGGTIRLTAHVDGDHVIVSVQDDGPGVSSDQLAVIFEPFMQLGTGGERRRGGTGLGLAITRAFAEQQGGEVTVESLPGHGATFRLTLPLSHRA